MKLTNEAFDRLKLFTMTILPAIGTLYFALSSIWNLPYGEQVVGTVTAVVTFLGICLKISTNQYNNSQSQDDDKGDDE